MHWTESTLREDSLILFATYLEYRWNTLRGTELTARWQGKSDAGVRRLPVRQERAWKVCGRCNQRMSQTALPFLASCLSATTLDARVRVTYTMTTAAFTLLGQWVWRRRRGVAASFRSRRTLHAATEVQVQVQEARTGVRRPSASRVCWNSRNACDDCSGADWKSAG
jgi:hypothetical protein